MSLWCGVRGKDINISLSCLPGAKVKTRSLKLLGIYSRLSILELRRHPATPASNFSSHYAEHTNPKYLCHHLHKQMMYEENLYRYKNGFFDVVAAHRTYGNDLSFYDLLNAIQKCVEIRMTNDTFQFTIVPPPFAKVLFFVSR